MGIEAILYNPTQIDIDNIKPRADLLKVSGDGVFATRQGEGVTSGKPSVFLRLHYCNLTCGVPDGWKCDTWYTWDKTREEYWTEPNDLSYSDTVAVIESAWAMSFPDELAEDKRAVITGGEPLLQQDKIVNLLTEMPEWTVEIETNGTIIPVPELHGCQFNCSPKLRNSGNTKRRRYKPEALRAINALENSWFKFVVTSVDDLEEIDQIVTECELDKKKILIMPEGQTADVVEGNAQMISGAVEDKGWNLTMRNQLIWYGDKRRT